jgi:hypothetical protein
MRTFFYYSNIVPERRNNHKVLVYAVYCCGANIILVNAEFILKWLRVYIAYL